MSQTPKSKLSASNFLLLIICLIVIVAILVLNIINTRNLTQLRSYINSISNENASIEVLRNTNKELLEAENAYRLYLSTRDTLYSGKFLSHIVASVNELKTLKSTSEASAISVILAGIEQKIQMANAVDQLKRIQDSIATGNGNAGFYINPYWFKKSNTALVYQYDSLIQKVDTSAANANRKKAFLKKLGNIFSSKEDAKKDQSEIEAQTSVSADYTKKNPLDQAVMDVDDFYAGKYNSQELRIKLDYNEKALAQINLVLEYQLNDALKRVLGQEELSEKQKEEQAINNALQARQSIKQLSWVSYIVIFFVALILFYNIRKSNKYENEILAARIEAEKLALTKGRFLSNMSHEIRSPLTSIIGFTEQLNSIEIDPEKRKYLEAIKTSSDHLLTTVNDILDFSKLDAGKLSLNPQPFSIVKIINEVLFAFNMAAETKGIGLTLETSLEESMLVNADPYRLKQILFNLTSNAIKFTEKGNIKIIAESISSTDKKVDIRISVKDSGVGIPEDQLQFIFQEFAQASNTKVGGRRAIRGTGLGLSICKMLVELQGGKIDVKSELNVGSTFTFVITYNLKEAVKKQVSIQPVEKEFVLNSPVQATGIRALVVEDNDMNIMLLSLLLRKAKIEFDVAKDGEEALVMYDNNTYNIVLTDINIPKLTGDQVAATIRKNTNKQKATIPIIALTASIIGDDTDQYYKMGINELLIKPFKEKDFNAILNKYLG